MDRISAEAPAPPHSPATAEDLDPVLCWMCDRGLLTRIDDGDVLLTHRAWLVHRILATLTPEVIPEGEAHLLDLAYLTHEEMREVTRPQEIPWELIDERRPPL